jgi:uncharacterized protein YkwD
MKLSYQIFIILFVILSLFIIKDDIETAYHRLGSSIKKGDISHIFSSGGDDGTGVKSAANITTKATETPGPLRVVDKLLAPSSTVRLSVKGAIASTNVARKSNGNLPALEENSKLNLSAQKKLDDMFAKQYFEHVSPSGTKIGDLADAVSYEYILIGENLALGNFKNDQALVDAWMASPGHRANVLNAHYTQIGIAVGHRMFEGRDTWMAVQHFGLPEGACPRIDESLHISINALNKQIKTMEGDLAARRQRIDSGAVYDGMTTNEQIDKYNEIVSIYNKLVTDIKQKISVYNSQINAFNVCITSHT